MKLFATALLTLLFALPISANAFLFSSNDSDVQAVYAPEGIANKGYDIVAYFNLDAGADPILGDDAISTEYNGATYRFANIANKQKFLADPEKYLPAYGGYCAYAVAKKGSKVSVKANAWVIKDGVLYLNYNKSVLTDFEEDIDTYIKQADDNWKTIQEQE